MLRQMTALFLALLLAIMAVPPALASESYSASTSLSSADSDKLNNLRLAAQAIDGVTVGSGEHFSFNDIVGPREKRRGYREARNGRGATVTGGGVAQVASTLYIALLKMGDDVDIDPVKTYGKRFSDDYVQNPSLAIVTDYDAGIDLGFTNLGDALTIDMWLGDDDLWCVITVGQKGGLGALDGGKGGLSFLDGDGDVVIGGKTADDLRKIWDDPIDDDEIPDDDAIYSDDDDDFFEDDRIIDDDDDYDDEIYSDDPGDKIIDDDLYDDEEGGKLIGGTFYDDADGYKVGSVPEVRSVPGDTYSYRIESQPERQSSSGINCGGDKDVLHNVKLAAECLNDTMLDPGDVFSFNDVVGPRTKKYGYRRAINGRGAKVVGGGVAQVASALWLAIKDCDDIEILEKSTYGKRYNQRYVSDPADAILTDYASGRDFSFRYTGRSSLTIYAYVEDGWLYCDVYED